MPRSGMPLRRTKKLVTFVLLFVALALMGRLVWALVVVHRIAATVQRSVEIGFGPLGEPDRWGRAVDQKLYQWSTLLPFTVNLDALDERFHRGTIDVAFRTVEEFELYYFDGLPGDLGRELQRFRHLKKVTITDNGDGNQTEAQWARLLTGLRALPELEELEIGDKALTDAALAPLAGAPRLRVLTITYGRLTARSVEVLKTLPRLQRLSIYEVIYDEEAHWLETKERVLEAFPDVQLDFND